MMADWERIATEVRKLPPRQAPGSPINLQRSIACGFIFAGNDAPTAMKKAEAFIEFWDWVTKGREGT